MKTIIAGSRSITDYEIVERAIECCPFKHLITEIVSGTARGVDSLGEKYAKEHGIPITRFPAEWQDEEGNHNPAAGHQRNARMAVYADALIVVWDGVSGGTKNMIKEAKVRGLETSIYVDSKLFSWS